MVKFVGFSDIGIRLNKYKNLESSCLKLQENLANICVKTAGSGFKHALYSGTNDVVVSQNTSSEESVVSAVGNAVTFIEFGTGIRQADDHPKRNEFGFSHGGFGKGMGKRQAWVYKGDPGNNGIVIKNGNVLTRGDPAQMIMYGVGKDIKENASSFVRKFFEEK